MTSAEHQNSPCDRRLVGTPGAPCAAADAPLVRKDRELVDRCLSGEPSAWDMLYQKYHPVLCNVVKSLLQVRGTDVNLVEEIAARVWYGLVRDQGRRLDRYDGRRGYRLSTFLAAFAKRELLQHLRSEQRRRSRERSASVTPIVHHSPSLRQEELLVDEFLDTLTPREREFFERHLISEPDVTHVSQFSNTNAWQLKHRVQRKLKEFLREPE